MQEQLFQVFSAAAAVAGKASSTVYLGHKLWVCDRCRASEPIANCKPEQTLDMPACPLPKDISSLEPYNSLDPIATLTQTMCELLGKEEACVIVDTNGVAYVALRTKEDKGTDVYTALAIAGSGFPVAASRVWYVPKSLSQVMQQLPGLECTLCMRRVNACVMTLLLIYGDETLYVPLASSSDVKDIILETDEHNYRLTAWNIEERRYKTMVLTNTPSLTDILNKRPGRAHKQPATEKPVDDKVETPEADTIAEEAHEATADEIVADTQDTNENLAATATTNDVTQVAETTTQTKPKHTRTRKQAVPGLVLDWDSILTYLQQPVLDTMTVSDAAAEMRIIRDIQIAASRRQTNLALSVVDKADTMTKTVAELATIKEVLSKLKI